MRAPEVQGDVKSWIAMAPERATQMMNLLLLTPEIQGASPRGSWSSPSVPYAASWRSPIGKHNSTSSARSPEELVHRPFAHPEMQAVRVSHSGPMGAGL